MAYYVSSGTLNLTQSVRMDVAAPSVVSNYVLSVIGLLTVAVISIKLIIFIISNIAAYVIAPRCRLGVDPKTLGTWAVITGATAGCGKEFALQLSRTGLDIVLISRSQQKLDDVAATIRNETGVRTKCIVVDFTEGPHIYDRIAAELTKIGPIAVLVNNVGIYPYPYPDHFLNYKSDKVIRDVIRVNIESVTFMTRIVLPGMVARGKGAIINISSLVGTITTPLFAVYSATKAYIDFFSRALTYEYKSSGVIIQTLLPGFLSTTMSHMSRWFLVPYACDYVRSSLATLGWQARTAGCWPHSLSLACMQLPQPQCLLDKAAWFSMTLLRRSQAAALEPSSETSETAEN